MTNIVVTTSFDGEVTPAEVRARLSEINLHHALNVITKLSSQYLRSPDSPELARYANPLSLSLLAKAIVLNASENGRELDLSDKETNDIRWLLLALKSMHWHSRTDAAIDPDEALTSSLMREAYARIFLDEHPFTTVGRSFSMFHEHISLANKRNIDVNAAMQAVAGVSVHDLWVLCAAIYIFYFMECAKENGPWTFTADDFVDSPKAADVTAALRRVLQTIARTPDEIRQMYLGNGKYRHDDLPDEYWSSEFNILRDVPIVALGNGQYCCPFPLFAWARGSIGYYFDLVNYFGEIEKETNKTNRNPLDNKMSGLLGDVFQEYVGEQLHSLPALASHLRSEFAYTVGKRKLDSPDWIVDRLPDRPVFFECKARRPTLLLQSRCSPADREQEIRRVIARAISQLCEFMENLRAGYVPVLRNIKATKCIYALVLYESFPFHALPKTRQEIDRVAAELAPCWASLRADVSFVPLSVRELEFAIRIEQERNVPIEDQFTAYALYRNSAPFEENEKGYPRFAQHFGDYANERWACGIGRHNQMQVSTATRFLEFLRQELFAEST